MLLPQRDPHPTLSWQDAGLLTGCVIISNDDPTLSWQDAGLLTGCVITSNDEDASTTCTDKEEGPNIKILEEPTKNAIKNQAILGIRLVQQGLRMQEQGLEMVEVAVKGSAIEDLPNILHQMMCAVSPCIN